MRTNTQSQSLLKVSPRDKYLRRVYGITLSQYEDLLKKQKDSCAICVKHRSLEKKSLAIDHDHKTGEIFGILCQFCNYRLVGRIRNPHLFAEAAKYLQKGTGWFVPKKVKKKKRKKKRVRNS